MTPARVRIATRASALALRQAELVAAGLSRISPDLAVEIVPVTTAGDRASAAGRAMGAVGAFTREIDRAVLEDEADLAVHSLKDLPIAPVEGIVLGAVPLREDPADVLCARTPHPIETPPPGAVVGAGGPRRRALLLCRRPDLRVETIRGNVETRLQKLHDHLEMAAIVLAAAGLRRLRRGAAISQRFDPREWLPAPGQGALAVTRRAGDDKMASLVFRLDDGLSRAAVTAERAFLAEADAGCRAPVGALADWRGGCLHLRAMLASLDGSIILTDELADDTGDAIGLGRRLAGRMIAAGGGAILDRARAESREATHE